MGSIDPSTSEIKTVEASGHSAQVELNSLACLQIVFVALSIA